MHSDNSSQIFNDEDETTFSDLEPEDEQQTPLDRFFKPFGIKLVTHAVEEEEDDDCEFDLRMTDVPDEVLDAHAEPDLLEVRLASVGKHLWIRTPGKRLLASMLLLTLAGVFIGISSFGHATLDLFPLFSSTPQVKQSLTLDQRASLDFPASHNEENYIEYGTNASVMVTPRTIPNYCSSETVLGQGKQIGNFPVWATGIDDTAKVHLFPVLLQTIQGWKGWTVPLHIIGRYNYIDSISLAVFNTNSTSSPLMQDKYTPVATAHLFLDTKHVASVTGIGMRKLGTWDVSLYVPTAGCYGLIASWGTGHWMITFAAGQ
jgi:hypothetical protein